MMFLPKKKVTPVRKLTDQIVENLRRYEVVCFGVPREAAEKLAPTAHLSIYGYSGLVWSEFLTIPTRIFFLLVNEVFLNARSASGSDEGATLVKDVIRDLEAASGGGERDAIPPFVIDGIYTTHKGANIRVEVALMNDNTVRLTRR